MVSKDPYQGPFHKKMLEVLLFWLDDLLLLRTSLSSIVYLLLPCESQASAQKPWDSATVASTCLVFLIDFQNLCFRPFVGGHFEYWLSKRGSALMLAQQLRIMLNNSIQTFVVQPMKLSSNIRWLILAVNSKVEILSELSESFLFLVNIVFLSFSCWWKIKT